MKPRSRFVPLVPREASLARILVLLCVCVCAATFLLACRKKKPEVRVFPIDPATSTESALPKIVRAPSGELRESLKTIVVGGKPRQYLLVAPSTLRPGKSYPLVLVFHGDGGDAVGFHHAWPFERATGGDAILVYPDGIGATWDLETTTDNRDVAYVTATIDAVASALPVDRARIFAAGYSSGGFFSNVLACHRPALLRAIASNAGGAPYNQRESWPNGYPKCPGQEPVAMLALHGEGDFAVTLDSGRFSAEYWAYVNGCRETEMEETAYPECRLYRGCPNGKAVGYCKIGPLGHWVWDRSAEVSWTFFERQ